MVIGGAALTSLALALALLPGYIETIRRLEWGQLIREEGPKDHQAKKGTPTMGGVIIVIAAALGMMWALRGGHSLDVLVVLLCMGASAVIGFIDDFSKIRKKRNLGLSSRQKLVAQLVVASGVAVYVLTHVPGGGEVNVAGLLHVHSDILAGIIMVFAIIGTSNGVNLTDGLDGLAAGTTSAACSAYAVICAMAGRTDLAIAAASMAGACLGFLWYNRFPARIFMGDTGSLGLGAGLASLAVITRSEWLLVIIGGVFVAETMSVILQVLYFKATNGKRIFRMSPLHHHFCLGGLHETRVTGGFWMAGTIFAALGIGLWLSARTMWSGI